MNRIFIKLIFSKIILLIYKNVCARNVRGSLKGRKYRKINANLQLINSNEFIKPNFIINEYVLYLISFES